LSTIIISQIFERSQKALMRRRTSGHVLI